MPTRRKPCKFFANGGCLKGENCNYSHDGDSPQKNICNFHRKGACLYGSHCKYEHGKASLEQQASSSSANSNHLVKEKHLKACQEEEKRIDALKLGEEIECSVCLEHVLKKSKDAERKFGILSECDHPFCISCIRNWRSSSPAPGMDVNTAQKTCPICRKVSYFVIPSVTWYSTKEEKQEIIDNYKGKLKSIDCKHFKFGNGHCPFGAGCFYKHTVKPGSYTWIHHRPPPRSPLQRRSNFDDMDGMIEIFGNLMTLDDLLDVDLENNPEDLQFAGLEPWQWDFFWSQLGYDTSDDEIDFNL